MRHGLMLWRENELSQLNVLSRQNRLQSMMVQNNLDGMLFYTNHVRSAAVSYLTGFTPYWSDALLFIPALGQAVFMTALSKRVGTWIQSTSPTTEVAHSPHPGTLAGEHIAHAGYKNIGVIEKDHMPGGLMEEINAAAQLNLIDSSALFATVRQEADDPELRLAETADKIAAEAFSYVPNDPVKISDVTAVLERAVRNAGAEECYIAIAPDLSQDIRLARLKGQTPLGDRFAVRLSVAYNGVWIRRTESFCRDQSDKSTVHAANWLDNLAITLDPSELISTQLSKNLPTPGVHIEDWTLEAPLGTRPLKVLSTRTTEVEKRMPYGVLTIQLSWEGRPIILARPVGLNANRPNGASAA